MSLILREDTNHACGFWLYNGNTSEPLVECLHESAYEIGRACYACDVHARVLLGGLTEALGYKLVKVDKGEAE